MESLHFDFSVVFVRLEGINLNAALGPPRIGGMVRIPALC